MNKFLRLCFLEVLSGGISPELKIRAQDKRTGEVHIVHVDFLITLKCKNSMKEYSIDKNNLNSSFECTIISPFNELSILVMTRYLLTGKAVTIVEKRTKDRYSAYIEFTIRTEEGYIIDLQTFEDFYIFTEQLI